MLVLEIAAGVLLGLLAYRGIDSYCKKHDITLTAAIIWNLARVLPRLIVWTVLMGIVAGIGYVVYFLATHPRSLSEHEPGTFIGIVIVLTLMFLFALRSDVRQGRKYKLVAAKTACRKCGEMSLKFTGFKDGYKSGVGAYDHPKAKCSGCGHEQMLEQETPIFR
jgi:hypothetical protein